MWVWQWIFWGGVQPQKPPSGSSPDACSSYVVSQASPFRMKGLACETSNSYVRGH